MDQVEVLTSKVPSEMAGKRLDQVLAALFPSHSRSRLQQWLKAGYVCIDTELLRAKHKVKGGEYIEISAIYEEEVVDKPQPIPLNIVHQDAAFLVINKPVGLVVHPAAGHREGTLLNALLYQFPELSKVPRAGIVHRIDKDTSGLLLIARTITAHTYFVKQLQSHKIARNYDAVVKGVFVAGGTIDAPLDRHPVDRKRRAVTIRDQGKPAITHYRVKDRFRAHTHIKVTLETGRTHQIRVHMAHIHHPVIGDQIYGGRLQLPKGASEQLILVLRSFKRQALHATSLSFAHPITQEPQSFVAPLPNDMLDLLTVMKADNNH